MSYKKTQAEIMGLIVIVVLITLGLYFAISFRTSVKLPELKTSYSGKQLSTTFIVALLQTNVKECSDYNIEDLIIDCVTKQFIYCEGFSSCELLNKTLNETINNSLIKWNMAFNFSVYDQNNDIIYTIAQNCGPRVEKIRKGVQPIALYPIPGDAKVTLTICKQ